MLYCWGSDPRLFQPQKMSFINNKKTFSLLAYIADNADSVLGSVLYCASSFLKHWTDIQYAAFSKPRHIKCIYL